MAFIQHNHRSIYFRCLGDANKPALVFAHPLGMNQSVWDDLITPFISDYQIITWDLPGHGHSEALSQPTLTVDDLVDDLLAITRFLGIKQFHFIGTSVGGVIGQALMHHHSGKLLSAMLTNTGAKIGTLESWSERAELVHKKGIAALANDIVPRWFGSKIIESNAALRDGWVSLLKCCDTKSYAALCMMLGTTDFQNKSAPQGLRVTLVGGSDDIATPPALMVELSNQLHTIKPHILDGVGHVPSIEAPPALCEHIRSTIK